MSQSHTKVWEALNYLESFLVFSSAASGYDSISVFVSLHDVLF